MAYIYQITNDINGKIYIGKTERTVQERFNEHCRDAFRRDYEKRPLYAAMRKYGVEHFHVEILEETNNPEDREIYWIETKCSFKNGYNATMGGDGKHYIDYDLVVAMYKELQNQSEVADRLNIDVGTVHRILNGYHVEILNSAKISLLTRGMAVNQYSLEGEYIQTFPSTRAAAKSLGKVDTKNQGTGTHISEACRGKRKTASGYIWRYTDSSD